MSTSSARPDHLDEAARRLTEGAHRLGDAAGAVRRAASAYDSACPDRPLDVRSPPRALEVVLEANGLAADVARVADAFRHADTGPRVPVTVTSDDALSLALWDTPRSRHSPLTRPTREAMAQGRVTARAMVRAAERGGAAGAVARLAEAGEDAEDPVFAAAVFNELGADRLQAWTEELAGFEHHWRPGHGPLQTLAAAWATATRSLDRPAPGAHLDVDLLRGLLAAPLGRNVLRALAGAAGVRAGTTYLERVRTELLVRSAATDADLSAAHRILRGTGREGDPDAAFLHAVGLTPGAGPALLADHRFGPTLERRTRWLLDQGTNAQAGAVLILRQVLDALPPAADGATPRARSDVLRAVYDWVARHPRAAVGEPLAQFLADSVATDPLLLTARVDTVRGGVPGRVLAAVTRFERPWLTALLALEAHGLARVAATLHAPPDVRLTALDDLHVLTDALEAAAAESDRPGPSSPLFFLLLRQVAGPLAGAVTAGAPPVVGTVVRAGLGRAIDEWKAAAAPEPGTRGRETRLHREALRRRVWVAIAQDPRLAADLVWTVGGPGPGADAVLGARIRSVDDLLALDGGGADLDELAGWAAAQPPHLRALVAGYLDGA